MKTMELKGEKIAEVYVIHETKDSCFDNTISIRDNHDDARLLYERKRTNYRNYASRHNLDFVDEGNHFMLYEKAHSKMICCVSIRPYRFKLTTKTESRWS